MYKLQLKDNPQRGLWLVGEKVRLGSGRDNELVLEGLGINRCHAQILINAGRVELENVDGSCFVNEKPVSDRCLLNKNDEIRIGQHRLVVLDSKQIDKQKATSPVKNAPAKAPAQKTDDQSQWSLFPNHAQLQGRDFIIGDSAVLGRGKGCDFVVPYKLLSREHARFSVDDRGLIVTDLDSSNGTFINGKRVKEARLKGDETVTFAKLSFTVRAPKESAKSLADSNEDELNRTMMRPALSMEVALQHIADENQDVKATLEIDAELQSTDIPEPLATTPASHQGRWVVVAVAIAGLAVGCWWLLPHIK